jgi:hypothetical protein
LNKVKQFFANSWHTDPVAFCFEMLSFVCVVGASMYLSLTADNPDMRYVYPFFFIGSMSSVMAYRRRKLAWQLITSSYFMCINIFGFGRAVGIW